MRRMIEAAKDYAITLILACAIGLPVMFGLGAMAQSPTAPGGQITTGPALNPCGPGGIHLCAQADSVTVQDCGTAPIVVGNDTVGNVITGSGATTCRINFAVPFALAPLCTVVGDTTSVSVTRTTTSLTMTAVSAAARYNWHCFGKVGG